jgi:hypothetical protein
MQKDNRDAIYIAGILIGDAEVARVDVLQHGVPFDRRDTCG